MILEHSLIYVAQQLKRAKTSFTPFNLVTIHTMSCSRRM